MECLLPYLCMVTVPHIMVGLERMLDYRGVGLARFHCNLKIAQNDKPSITYIHTHVRSSVVSGSNCKGGFLCSSYVLPRCAALYPLQHT